MLLTKAQVARAQQLSELLWQCGQDVDEWADRIGWDVKWLPFPNSVRAGKSSTRLYFRSGMNWTDQILAVAHETFHRDYHEDCVAYKRLNDGRIFSEERSADAFAVLTVEPSVLKYETDEEYLSNTTLPLSLARLRLEVFHQTGY